MIAPLFAHPRFVPIRIQLEYENMMAMRVLHPNEGRGTPFGLFLDPHTGIPLPTSSQRASASHAPLSFIADEFQRLSSTRRRLLILGFTDRDGKTRIIHARGVTKRERKDYEENKEKV